ncbi:hypothetical protein ACFU99_38155 [Streptomyces sp. NPDC057654]|uniref:hypothetical protein n=1 Tax=Streptomyces sp. NPDC057654 TaxID=3346196 RepID=UPI0036958E0F
MHFEWHQIRSHELIREADEYRLAQQARRAEPAPRHLPTGTLRPTPRRLLAWLRGRTTTLPTVE